MAMKIELFVPGNVPPQELDLEKLFRLTGKRFMYASKGRHAIGHIISALEPKNNIVLVSPYMCDSVFKKLDQMGMKVEFYDIDPLDLNPSAESIKEKLQETDAGIVIAPSLYGNPAELDTIERICKASGAYLVDDAAQSFGAKLNDKFVGCFGDAGLFAFSPGKATFGHMGALFWVRKEYRVSRTHHPLVHKIEWWNYKYNRLRVYDTCKAKKSICFWLSLLAHKNVSIENDDIEEFEKELLGGSLAAQLNGSLDYRKKVLSSVTNRYENVSSFRVVVGMRGETNPHKIVLAFCEKNTCIDFKNFLAKRNISFFSGYDISGDRFSDLNGCRSVDGLIVELPIEENLMHMKYIMDSIDSYFENELLED